MRYMPIHNIPFRTIVPACASIAGRGRGVTSRGWPGSSFSTDSLRIWRKEMTIMTEKTRIPRGSRRRRPIWGGLSVSLGVKVVMVMRTGIGQDRRTGKRLLNELIFHATSLLVDHMMIVHRRSSALSVSDAIRDRDDEKKTCLLYTSPSPRD